MVNEKALPADILQALMPYKLHIEAELLKRIETFGPATRLRQAATYSLMTGGKRIRPALVMMIAKILGNEADVTEAALSVEFFHTASLIADDLPCMDNDDMRRDKPSLHKVYGESTSLLASYALIAAGYEGLVRNGKVLKESNLDFSSQSDHLSLLAIENVTYNAGMQGAPWGQLLDVQPPDLTLETVMEVMEKKTVTLFEIAFVCGWLFGGGGIDQLDKVKKAAGHFGRAFQIADDLSDQAQDVTNDRKINLATIIGHEKAMQMFHKEKESLYKELGALHLNKGDLAILTSYL